MKNKLFIITLLIGTLLFCMTSCDDNKSEFLDDYSTILYFVQSGEQELPIYRTGENTTLSISVNKAGSNLSTSSSAQVVALTQEELDAYNAANFIAAELILLPSECYQILTSTSVQFGSKELNKFVDIDFLIDKVEALGSNAELTKYAFAIKLVSEVDSVNDTKNIVVYRPQVLTPTVFFEKTGYIHSDIDESRGTTSEIYQSIALPIKNKWDFYCDVDVRSDWVDEYNQENSSAYTLLPASAYKLEGDGIVTFTTKDPYKRMKISVDAVGLPYGNYLLPLHLASCSIETFEIDNDRNTSFYGFKYAPALSKLSKIDLKGKLSSPHSHPGSGSDSQGVAALIDGDPETYFHSNYTSPQPNPYIQVDLGQKYSAVNFDYITRSGIENGNPQEIQIQVSNNGTEYVNLESVSGLPTGMAARYTSPVFVSAESFRYVRIVVTQSVAATGFFSLAELEMKGITAQ